MSRAVYNSAVIQALQVSTDKTSQPQSLSSLMGAHEFTQVVHYVYMFAGCRSVKQTGKKSTE